MKYDFKFSNLLGTVYRKGDVMFTPDGNSVISPVGNKISIYDLKNNKGNTLPVESNYNYTALDLSPNGCTVIAVNEKGEMHMISLISCTIIHRHKFKHEARSVKFSPDGKHIAVCCDKIVFVLMAPGPYTGEYRSFLLERIFKAAHDDTTCIDWSQCSQILAVGSKDSSTKLYALPKFKNFRIQTLGGHTDPIVGCFFENRGFDITTVGRNGQLCVWESSIDSDGLVPITEIVLKKKRRKIKNDSDDEDDVDNAVIPEKSENPKDLDDDDQEETSETLKDLTVENQVTYKKLARHYLGDAARKENSKATLTAACYHKDTKVMIVGFSTGAFFLYELPEVNLIHSLSISEHMVSSIAVSKPGDWIALGCSGIGQLLVWEWQSEQYVMKQQGHSTNMTCLCYSPDGAYIVTGGHDGKVKLWNTLTGFCFVTFTEHASSITGVTFSMNKKFFVSSSLDGTVRCYDILRYRNFRTFTSPSLVQFSCVALDSSGELCAAGGQDVFEIFIWSVKFGKLLEVLGGHEGPVSSLSFSPILASSKLASASWDKTVKLWNCIESSGDHETIQLTSDALQVAFRPDGEEIAVATLDSNISFFNTKSCDQTGSVEGRSDLGSGRADADLVTAKQNLKAKSFTTICYSADGTCLLAGGNSKNICLYNIKQSMLIKKFEVTQNRSLDAVNDFINRRMLTEFGNMALVEERTALEGGNQKIRLPGVKQGDMADRNVKPEVRVLCIRFSPTGESFAAAATEGLLIYSQGGGVLFRPYRLEMGATPQYVEECLKDQQWSNAVTAALQLNDRLLIQEAVETIPLNSIELTISSLDKDYADRLLLSITNLMENSRHIELLMIWVQFLITNQRKDIPMPTLLALEKIMTTKYQQLSKICEFNKYTIRCVKTLCDAVVKDEEKEEDVELHSDDESSGRGTAMSDSDDT